MFVKRAFKIGLLLLMLLAVIPLAQAQDAQGRVCVAAYNDANANGMREPMEPLLADVVVTLQNEQAISVANYVTTGQAEPHCFEGLPAGTYLVNFSGGMVEPTGESNFAVTLTGADVPAQVQFGAAQAGTLPQAAPAAASASQASSQNTLLRAIFSLAGAVIVMIGLAAVGILVFWMRFRRA